MAIDAYELYKFYALIKSKYTNKYIRYGSRDTFEKRKDVKSFIKLGIFLPNNGILNSNDLRKFLIINAKRLDDDFLPFNLSNRESIDYWKEHKNDKKIDTVEMYYNKIMKSFKYIDNYCADENISPYIYFHKGKIPKAIKDYKEDKIDETIIIFANCVDLLKIKKSSINYIYYEKLIKKYDIIQSRIHSNPQLVEILATGMKYLEYEFKKRST